MTSFSRTRPLLISYAYVSIKSVHRTLLSSFELKAVLLISSVKRLCLSLLNLRCVFNIGLLFLMNCFDFFKTIYVNFIFSRSFISFSS